MVGPFSIGEKVKFIGLRFGEVEILPQEGVLEAVTNATTQGVMAIADKVPRMMFTPDGKLYCHGHYGVLLERIEDAQETIEKA